MVDLTRILVPAAFFVAVALTSKSIDGTLFGLHPALMAFGMVGSFSIVGCTKYLGSGKIKIAGMFICCVRVCMCVCGLVCHSYSVVLVHALAEDHHQTTCCLEQPWHCPFRRCLLLDLGQVRC